MGKNVILNRFFKFIFSKAKFYPADERFTKTVNAGDANVTVDFTEVTPTVSNKNWRFNGTTSSTDTILVEYDSLRTTYTIEGEVATSDGGVYELQISGQRGQGVAGLLRLIVRGKNYFSFFVVNICNLCTKNELSYIQSKYC